MLAWVSNKLSIDPGDYYNFIRLLAAGKVGAFQQRLQELLQEATSFYQTGTKKAELFYSGFMLGLLSTLSSTLIPKVAHGEQALVIEYKVSPDVEGLTALAEAGLAQIAAKGYGAQVRAHAHVKKLLQVCMAFCGKQVALAYREDML